LSTNQQIAADTDGISGITSFDAVLILRFVAANGQNANTGAVGNWKFSPVSRPYSNLNGDVSGDNYIGFLLGDIDGDWTPPATLAGNDAAQIQ
jgi:hypothetical protein